MIGLIGPVILCDLFVIVQPAGLGIGSTDQNTAAVFVIGGAVVLKISIFVRPADNLQFTCGMRHDKPKPLGQTGNHGLGMTKDVITLLNRDRISAIAEGRTALEEIIRDDARK